MNNRSPFNLHSRPSAASPGIGSIGLGLGAGNNPWLLSEAANQPLAALNVLRVAAARAAADIGEKAAEKAAEVGTQALDSMEKGRQAVGTAIEDMSFAVPMNVPSFGTPQRQLEDRLWQGRSKPSVPSGGGGGIAGVLGGVQGLLHPDRSALPMYKDKPYTYAPSGRRRPIYRRRRLLAILVFFVLAFFWYTGAFSRDRTRPADKLAGWSWLAADSTPNNKVDWLRRRDCVVEAMELSWDAYERYAWGHDEFHPISKQGHQMAPSGLGWIIIDSLDTLILMGLTSRVAHAREWISKSLTWDQDQDVNTFETTIRMLGGLLSAHYLSNEFPQLAPQKDDDPGALGEDLYLEKARDLADRLLSAFDSPSGIPYASVNLGRMEGLPSHDDDGASSTAEATTLQLEFKYLAKLTGEKFFWDKVEKVMQIVDDNAPQDGLVPIFIYATTGEFRGRTIRLGSRGDSYYEYLIKQHLQTGERVYLDMWNEALAGTRKHLVTYTEPSRFTIIGERPDGLGGELSPKMDHLVCFMPGTIALAATGGLTEKEARMLPTWTKQHDADMQLARELMLTCWGTYKNMATGLAPEITHFRLPHPVLPESAPHQSPSDTFDPSPDAAWRRDFVVKTNDRHNLQRPETVESLFYMWRITGEVKYREWGWEMLKSFVKHTAVAEGGGFTTLSNADEIPPPPLDNVESFWLAETLKYFFLLFSPNDVLPLDKVVINTEAHPLPRLEMGPLFKTGWARKPRDMEGNIIKAQGKS